MPGPTVTKPTTPVVQTHSTTTTNRVAAYDLSSAMPPAWRALMADELKKPYVKELEKFLASEVAAGRKIEPAPSQIFRALELTPPDKVKAVVLGQDPYPTPGYAHGLAFSVRRETGVIPASLKNIYKVMGSDLGLPPAKTGELTSWARHGVLLLNTCLTVRQGEPNSHAKKGWEQLTRAILAKVAESKRPTAYLLLGQSAQAYAPLVEGPKDFVVKGPHPSPLNGRKFAEWGEADRPFTAINTFLTANGSKPIDWKIE